MSVNGKPVGTTPVLFAVPEREWNPPYRFRLERDGYEPVEGELPLMRMPGRVVGIIATAGLLRIWRTPTTFLDSYDFVLMPDGASVTDKVPVFGSVAGFRAQLDYLLQAGVITPEEHRAAIARVGTIEAEE